MIYIISIVIVIITLKYWKLNSSSKCPHCGKVIVNDVYDNEFDPNHCPYCKEKI